jgi:hypothetical protein
MSRPRRASTLRGDRISVCLAGACAAHCVGAPLLAGILPVVGIVVADPGTEWVLQGMSLATSAITLSTGCLRNHRQWRAMWPFGAGAACMLGVRLLAQADNGIVQMLVLIGAGLVVAAHAVNIRLCRRAGAWQCGRGSLIAPAQGGTPSITME